MKNISFIDKTTLELFFQSYRVFLVPFVIIAICIVLFLTVLIPQTQDMLQTRDEEKALRDKIILLQQNLRVVSAVDVDLQDNQLQVLSSALPSDKDYAGIINAVTTAALESGVAVGDYSLLVGQLGAKSAQAKPSINVKFKLETGSLGSVRRFLTVLSQRVPVSDISDFKLEGQSTALSVQFYYKPVGQISVNYEKTIMDLSAKDKELVSTLATWKARSGINFSQQSATPSGSL